MDSERITEIYDKYSKAVYRMAFAYCKNKADAEDIMQETFVKLAIKKPAFKGKCSFKTWLFTIARNCAFDHLRKDKNLSDISLDQQLQLSDVTDTEKEFFKEEQKAELYKAMKKLNPDYYQVLYLMYFEDLDTSDIAMIMHKAKRQVSDMIFRARKSLRTELERKGFIYEKY